MNNKDKNIKLVDTNNSADMKPEKNKVGKEISESYKHHNGFVNTNHHDVNEDNTVKNGFLKNCLNDNKVLLVIDYKKLRTLNLSRCDLKFLPNLSKLVNLISLDVSFNVLKTLPNGCPHKLQHLYLSHNIFSEVPSCISDGLGALKTLDLSYNKLTDFCVKNQSLQLLQKLNLSDNQLVCVPECLITRSNSSVQELDLSNNDKIFEKTISNEIIFDLQLKKNSLSNSLRVLNLSGCSFCKSKLFFLSTFLNLSVLRLSNTISHGRRNGDNILWNIPTGFLPNIENMSELYLSGLYLNDVKSDIKKCVHLKVLDLSYNDITVLPLEICELSKLEHLDVSNNFLNYLPVEFGKLISLKKLFLSSNKLLELPESFVNLKNLELLDLYDNSLFGIPECISEMNLKELDLAYNYFDPVSNTVCIKNERKKCENDVLSNKYTELREQFIKNSAICAFTNRFSGPRQLSDYEDNVSDDRDDDSYSFSRSITEDFSDSDENKDDGLLYEPCRQSVQSMTIRNSEDVKIVEQENEEDWDKEYDSDEMFDPNNIPYSYALPTYSFDDNKKMFNKQDENSYCPGEYHPGSIRASRRRRRFGDSVEGQFDDD